MATVEERGTHAELRQRTGPMPEHVLRALLTQAGVAEDVADLRVEPLTALFTPGG